MTGWTAGDLEPALTGTALDGTAPVDLTAATAVMAHVRRSDGTTISRAVTLGNQSTSPGSWTLAWVTGDLVEAGGYTVEIEAMWPGSRPQTFGTAGFQVARQIA
jgi:hypothetical protein